LAPIVSKDATQAHFPQESNWSSTPFYVVGKSTASSLRAIRDVHPHSRFSPADIRGESSGTSEQLAKFILADLDSLPPKSRQKPFLYLTGDKNRDTLPDILRSGDIEISPLQVYQTQGSSRFPDDLKLALESSSHQGNDLSVICLSDTESLQILISGGSYSLHPLRLSLLRPSYDVTSICARRMLARRLYHNALPE
jgi:uroporphyrinogen-III synthase